MYTDKLGFSRSHAPALFVIHKYFQARHSGMDAGIQSQGECSEGFESSRTSSASGDVRGSGKLPSMTLDTGIHAGMTTLGHSAYNEERRSVGARGAICLTRVDLWLNSYIKSNSNEIK